MKNMEPYLESCEHENGFSFVLKASSAMAVLSLALAGSFAPEIIESGLNWGQGLVALAGGSLGAFLALHR